jgi:nucleoside-diphosphate-sugar epimerase/glycosyltransferase involved in cell wall biosynthesis
VTLPEALPSPIASTLITALTTDELVAGIPGPIVVTGVGGFVGAHLAHFLQVRRDDVFGTARSPVGWRFESFELGRRFTTPDIGEVLKVLESVRPRTIFNLAAHGAYSFQTDPGQIAQTNFSDLVAISGWAEKHDCAIVQAGSSSEYGWNCAGPSEDAVLRPNSLYAVTKAAASHWLGYRSQVSDLAACVLRLYSVYGPGEDPARLFPAVVREGLLGGLPPLAAPDTCHDFVFVDDVVEAFVRSGALVRTEARGAMLNIGTGVKTSMADVAQLAIGEFGLAGAPVFGDVRRPWDLQDWFGDPRRAEEVLGWRARTPLAEGLHRTRLWYEEGDRRNLLLPDISRRDVNADEERVVNISAVIACYRDAQAVPVMYERLKDTFSELGLNFEIIFVNDASPDNCLEVIEELSLLDCRVKGITHSRNFGSQSAFLSGMKESVGEYVVLLDGDLQDPPEVIREFWTKMHEGYDVVYGRRAEREATWFMLRASRAFYRVLGASAPFEIPRDAGDFSLMSREVVDVITSMPERDLFIRAQRAYAGFRQTGVDYKRPERMFGRTTNNFGKNVGWATRGVLAVSRTPLTTLSLFALTMFGFSVVMILAEVARKVLFPDPTEGLVSIRVLILGLGSLNLLAIAVVGEYVGRILEETRKRPRYVRRLVTEFGVTRSSKGKGEAGAAVDSDRDS